MEIILLAAFAVFLLLGLVLLLRSIIGRQWHIVMVTSACVAVGILGGAVLARSVETYFVLVHIFGWTFENAAVCSFVGGVLTGTTSLVMFAVRERTRTDG